MQNSPPEGKRLNQALFFNKAKSFPKITKTSSSLPPPQSDPTPPLEREKRIQTDSKDSTICDLTKTDCSATDLSVVESRLKELKERITISNQELIKTKEKRTTSSKHTNKAKWVKRDPELEFEVKIFAFMKELKEPMEEIYSSSSFVIDDKLHDLIELSKMILSLYINCNELTAVFTFKDIPMCPTTTFKSLLGSSAGQERELNFVIFTDQQWKEYLEEKTITNLKEELEVKDSGLIEQLQNTVEVEIEETTVISPTCLSISVKGSNGKCVTFGSLPFNMTIESFYSKLKESFLFDDKLKLRFDGESLLPTSQQTFEILGLEDGDSIDYF